MMQTTSDAPVGRALRSREDPGDSRLREGTIVGSYRVLSLLGAGATSQVYLAEHEPLVRRVALKMLRAVHAGDCVLVHRFMREARTVNRIRHEHIVEVTDLGDHPAGPYFVMELLEGTTLDAVIAREAPMGPDRCVSIATQIASAMEAAHAAGIVHRDLKPGNLFLVARDGPDFVKVVDFGIAKVAGASVALDTDTVPGMILGSPAYMSPEQVRGLQVDHRCDIYALGVVLYEMIAGQRPFSGNLLQDVLAGHVWHVPRPLNARGLRELDADLDALVMRCMAKAAEGRPGSMGEVRRQLDQIAAGRAARAIVGVPAHLAKLAVLRPGRVQPEIAGLREAAIGKALTLPSNHRWAYGLALVVALSLAGLASPLVQRGESAEAAASQTHARGAAGATASQTRDRREVAPIMNLRCRLYASDGRRDVSRGRDHRAKRAAACPGDGHPLDHHQGGKSNCR